MGKLSSIADRIKDTKERLEAQADKLASKLDSIDAAAPQAFARGHAFLDSQQAEVDEIENTLRQLSNLPLESLPTGSGQPTDAPKPLPAIDLKSPPGLDNLPLSTNSKAPLPKAPQLTNIHRDTGDPVR